MNTLQEPLLAGIKHWSRRQWLQRAGGGLGWLALAGLLAREDRAGRLAAQPARARPPHFPAKARSVIWIFANGGPSPVDTWNYRPELERCDGKTLDGFDNKTGFFPGSVGPLMKSPFAWKQHGESGTWVSELFPHLAQHVDKMAFLHSCFTNSNNHSPALFMMNTGVTRMGYPCVGSWVTYGLGSESDSLPGFVVMSDPLEPRPAQGQCVELGSRIPAQRLPGNVAQAARRADRQPAAARRTERGSAASPVGPAGPAEPAALGTGGCRAGTRRADRELRAGLPHAERGARGAGRAAGAGAHPPALRPGPEALRHFAAQCLLARRFVERGVRFVQIYSGGMENQRSWDGHKDMVGNHRGFAWKTDQPIAALLADLAQRGLLDSTLVIWGGEFGRLPVSQKGDKPGRDHNPHAFTVWLAGGGVKGGSHYGETDEIGFKAAVDPVASTTSTPRSWPRWAWTTRNSPSASRDSTSA